MEFSKITNRRIVIASTLALAILPACFRPTQRAGDDKNLGAATFTLGEIKGKSQAIEASPAAEKPGASPAPGVNSKVRAETNPNALSLASAKRFTFTVCPTDRKTSEKITNTPFVLADGDRKADVRTDGSGCFSFTHDVNIDPLADEVYVPVKRKLIAARDTEQRGTREISLAINPWSYLGSPEVVDLKKSSLPADAILSPEGEVEARLKGQVAAKGKDASGVTKSILFAEYYLNSFAPAAPATDGKASRILEILFKPMIVISVAGKQSRVIELQGADLAAESALMAEVKTADAQAPKEYGVWLSPAPVQVVKSGRFFKAQFEVSFPKVLGESAHYMLLVKLSPKNMEPSRLGKFEALLEVGSLAQMLGSNTLPTQMKDSNIGGTFFYNEKVKSLLDIATIQQPQQPAPVQPETAPAPAPTTGQPQQQGDQPPQSQGPQPGEN